MIHQNKLPFEFKIHRCTSYVDTCLAIKDMITRGAGSIGAAAGFAMAQAAIESNGEVQYLTKAREEIEATRPTAQNLFYATNKVYQAAIISVEKAINEAQFLADECASQGKKIGEFGNSLIFSDKRILTHCNAGWLALQDYGSALAPIYVAHDNGKSPFVWVDETRPRGQGARLTAWELKQHGVKHAIIPDNAAAYLMTNKKVDLIITGADRIAANGDVANKIGTLGRAILASYYNIPFYIAAPLSTFDLKINDGTEIPIEFRNSNEVLMQKGMDQNNKWNEIYVTNPSSEIYNPSFDITPASLITGIITDKGIIDANSYSIKKLFKDELH
jgi:S-methyl-5-thioribose-1-phosphate isomerase